MQPSNEEMEAYCAMLTRKGSELLDDVEAYLGKFVAYPSKDARIAHTLWIAHAHPMDAWESTPRIAFLSPEPGSGKTRALEITETLVPRPIESVNATPAYLFRKISDPAGLPTILYDEIDTIFGARAKENEEIRGVINAGHRRGATAGRCVSRGQEILTEELPAFCAILLAGMGNLPDTILARSVVVRMRRRKSSEKIQPYRRRIHSPEGHGLRQRLDSWLTSQIEVLELARPEMPVSVEDRDADVWEPLLAIADLAGGDWPKKARVAAVALVALARETTPSLGIRLLEDIRSVFRADEELISTEELLSRLCDLDEAPWGDMRGKPLSPRGLANYLRKYEVRSKTVRIGGRTPKGYARVDLFDAWDRYLDEALPQEAQHPQQTPHRSDSDVREAMY